MNEILSAIIDQLIVVFVIIFIIFIIWGFYKLYKYLTESSKKPEIT
jgi:flagellar biogenesis protein FliO